MSKYRITVEGKTYEMDVELIGSNGAPVQPVKVQSAPAAPAPVAGHDEKEYGLFPLRAEEPDSAEGHSPDGAALLLRVESPAV